MPQIQDYSAPETQGQNPIGGISPNLEAAGAVGGAIQHLANEGEQALDVLHRRKASREISDAYSTFANARSDWNQRIQTDAAKDDFEIDDFKSQYSDWVTKESEKINTPEGRNYFDRQASRLGGALVSKAVVTASVAAGNKAKRDLQLGINGDAATLENDPSQFEDVVASGVEGVGAMVDANPKLAPARPQLEAHVSEQAALSALRGYIKQDPGSDAEGRPGAAQAALDSGMFDKFLTPEKRKMVESQIHMGQKAYDADQVRGTKAQKDLNEEAVENWKQSNVGRLNNNSLTATEVMNATMDMPDGSTAPVPFKEKMAMINVIHTFAQRKFDSNPNVKADTLRRIHLDPADPMAITDPQDVYKMVKPGGLSPSDGSALMGLVGRSYQAQQDKARRKTIMSTAANQIRYKDPMSLNGSQWSADGDTKFAQFQDQMMQAEDAQRKANKPVEDLYDPKKPEYLGNKLEQYKTTPQERLTISASALKQGAAKKAPVQPDKGPDKLKNMNSLLQKLSTKKGP